MIVKEVIAHQGWRIPKTEKKGVGVRKARSGDAAHSEGVGKYKRCRIVKGEGWYGDGYTKSTHIPQLPRIHIGWVSRWIHHVNCI